MITRENYSHTILRFNTKTGMEKTGIIAAVTLCFKTEPESRITLWFSRKSEGGGNDYFFPAVTMEGLGGTEVRTTGIQGAISKELKSLASAAQAQFRIKYKPKYGKSFQVTGEDVKELKEKEE